MYSYWKRHSGALGRAVLLSLAAGTLFMGSAYAKDYTSPITMDYETDYGDNDVKGDYHDVLTRDNSNLKNPKLTYDFGKDTVVNIRTGGDKGKDDIAPIGHGRYDSEIPMTTTVIRAKTLNLDATTSYNNGSLPYSAAGIYASGGTNLTINGDVNIHVDNRTEDGVDYFVYGIDVPLAADNPSKITINGNLSMKGSGTDASSDDYWGIITKAVHANGGGAKADYQGIRWAPAGLYLQGAHGSSIDVNGDVDLRVKGIGILQDSWGEPTDSAYVNKINLNKGDIYVETPQNDTEGWYSAASYGGTVNINMNEAETAPLSHKVVLIGNVYASHEDGNGYLTTDGTDGKTVKIPTFFTNGKLNIGLNTKDSCWTGIIDNTGAKVSDVVDYQDKTKKNTANTKGSQIGEVNLYLANGAVWNYRALGKKNGNDVATMPSPSLTKYGVYDGISHLTSLTGGSDEKTAGIIKMTETDPIEISRASGTTKIWYDHEGSTPGTMKGGDVKVLNADAGAHMILITGKNGIEKGFAETDGAGDRNKVSEVLNSLAHKLWYTAGNSSLTGTVEIAEGLTSPALKTGTISFSTAETGTKQKGQGYYDYTPAEDTAEYKNGPIMTSENIGETRKADVDGNVSVYAGEAQDALDSAVAALYVGDDEDASEESPMIVDIQGRTVQLKAGLDEGNEADEVAGISVGHLMNINLENSGKAGSIHVTAGTDEKGNATQAAGRVYGVDVGAGTLKASAAINIDGVTTEARVSGLAGVYTSAGGTAAFEDLSIKNIKSSKDTRGRSSGIYADGGHVTIAGRMDISDIAGSAIRALSGSTISTGEGNITAYPMAESDANKNIYAVNTSKGTVNLNTGEGITPGKLDVTGDIKLTDDAQSVVNMNLNAASLWKGASIINTTSTYNDPSAQMNLAMEEGSSWNHTTGLSGDTAASKFAGSRISKLSGQGGVVYQDSDKPVTVYDYSGNKTVVYRHDSADPTMIQGGDFIVKKAASGSAITLVTGSEGIKAGFKDTDSAADRNKVSAVLNKLANKLYYSGYAKEKNLTGVVRIAEGLTASSASAAVGKEGEITFSDGTGEGLSAGQGYYAYVPDSEVVYKTGPITDSEKISETRKDEEGTVYVKAVNPNADSEKYVSALYAAGTADKANPMKVRMDGKNLDLNAASADKIAAAVYVTDNAHVEILNNAKDKTLSIHASNTDTRAANGILSKGSYSSLHMEGPVEISNIMTAGDGAAGISVDGQNSEVILDGTLTVKNVSGKREQGRGQNAAGIRVVGDNSSVSVTGPVDLSGIKGSSLRTTGADTEISVGGGTITAAKDEDKSHNYYAARVDKGTININMKDGKAGTNTTKITGDMYVTDQYGKKVVEYTGGALVDCKDAGKLNLALTDKDSFWTGVAAYDQYNDSYGPGGNTMHDIGEFNLYLANGASWTNEQQAHVTTGTLDTEKQVWKGSQLASLHGGSDEAHAGIIYQKHEDPIFVENYSGYERVFYEHEKDDPASIKGGAFKIANAEEGSAITLITDSTGLSSRWKETDDAVSRKQVSDVLNQLAGKLYYGNYKDGHLKGTVEIADGLTVSSKVFKTDDILFYTDSDVSSGAAKEAGWGHVQDKAVPDSSTYKNVPITGNLDADAVPSQKPYVDAGIVRKDGTYKFTSDTVLETTKDYSTMIDAREDVVIDAAGKTLTLRGTIDTPSISTDEHERLALIQSGQGKNLTINAGRLVLDAEQSASGGNTYGMAIDGSVNPTHVTVNGNVDVTSTSKVKSSMGGAYGIWARGRAVIDIHGTVTMKKENGWAVDADQNGFSFYGSGGILSTSVWGADLNQGATINVDNVDLKVNGNGLWTNIGGGIINVNGGSVEVNPNNGVGYSALLAECGTVNMNVLKDADGNVTGAGNNDVTIKGNVFAATGAINDVDKGTYTSINLGLTNERSSLTGVIWNGFRDEGNKNTTKLFYGRTNLWLSDGAQWHHEPYGSVEVKDMNYYGDKFKGSVVSNFHGGSSEAHSGYIFQGTPSKKARKLGITFKNYNGYTIVFYNHDETDPTQMIGGDITIQKAAEGSGITLVTDSKGLTAGFSTSDKAADQNKVSEVLNKLAQKLFYTANDGHLAGTVKIADGLTASSKSLKSGTISFSSDSTGTKVKGQGFYEYEPASDDVLTDPITGGMDKKYVNIGVEKTQGHYDFAKDSTITVTAGQYASLIGTVDAVNGPVIINGKGTTLSLINDQKGSNVARAVSTGLSKGNDVSITADRLNLDARTSGFRAQGIYADKGTVYVNADTHISTKASSYSRGIYAGGSSVIHMNGGLSNDVDTTAASYSALYADGNGRITVNMKDGKAGGGKVNLKGDIYTESITSEDDYYDESSENSTVDMALSGKESSWHGRSVYSTSTSDDDSNKGYGDFNLILDDGAVWTNEKVGSGMDAGSHVTKLTGGAEGKSGFILQNDKNPIAVDHYSGDTTVIYRHEVTDDSRRENAELYGNKAVTVSSGKFHITKADPGSSITLATDASGLNIGSRVYTDKNLVNDALDKLANQLVYAGYEDKDLTGTVRIAEGLTSPSISKALVEGKISYYDGKVAGTEAGEGYYHYRVVNPDAQTVDAYSQAITGDSAVDKVYVRTGVLEEGTHDYTFTKPDTTITVEKTLIAGGPWIRKISAAVSGGDNHDAYLQMNGNNLTVNTTSDTHTTGITAIGKGVVDLEDAGKVSVSAESTGGGQTAAIFVNGGGTVKVHNGTGDLDSKVLTLRAKGKNMANVAVIKAMNGIADAQSSIAIDGLVDVLADGKNGSNEAVSIVASKADIGGGSIKAVNGAAYAIRAYGEFNSANRAVVNVNTVKNAEGRITGAGNHRTEVEGNISLGGGMDSGAKAEVNLGLNTKDSYFKGDVAYLNASPNGQVNLYMGNGASWTGNNLSGSSVNARITGGASWTGYSSGNNMHLSLQDGALWNNIGSSHISSLAGNQGLIDMSGDKAGTVEAGNYSGNTTVIYRHEIKDNEGRDHASLYGNKEASIMGGDFKITNAAENSTITLLTDNAGVNTASTDYRDQNLVYDLMDKLAGKLYYSDYADGHLKGIVKIAEGLTASSAMMKMGDISFYTDKDKGKTAGEGYYKYDLVYPSEQVVNPMDKVIDGSEDSRNTYRDAGVYHDETESYDFTSKPAEVTASDHDDGVVHAKDNDVKVTTKDWLHVTAKDGGVGMASENGKTVSTEGNTQITAKDGIGVKADKGTVSLKGHTIISAGTGMEAVNGGTISADGTTDMTTGEGKNALHADGDGSTISLKDGTISGAVLAENKGSISTAGAVLKGAATASKEGTIHLDGGSTSEGITADGGTIYTAGTDVKGEALAKAKGTLSMTGGNAGAVTADGGSASTDGTAVKGLLSAKNGGSITMTNGSAKGLSIGKDSAITAKLDKKDASIQGDIANEGTASLTLGGGASWIGDSTGSGKTNASIGEGSTWTGRSTNGNTTVELAGTWKQTGDSTIASLTGRNGTLDKTSETSGDTTIDHAAGTLNLLYSHSAEDPTTFYGGDTTIGTADSGTTVNMVTDSRGLTVSGNRARWANYKNQVSETLNRMAHKLHYTANDGNIKGTLKIAEGLTSSSASLRAENLTFDETGTGSYVYDPVKDDLTIEYGSEETQMMKGTKSALLGVSMMWRSNNNDLQRRLGDLRLGQAESGVWARYVGGKNKFDEQNTYMSQTYDIGQVGYDRKAGSWLVGAALDYGKGDVNYTGGKGKEHMATLALYGTRVSDDGKYFDIIFKTGRLKNEFHVSNEIGNRLNADYHTWGNSISAEYGKRFVRDDGFYLDPSVELTMGRLNSKNFSGHSDLGELNVKQHDFDSAIGRIGLGIGRQTERSNAFLKLALAHEFGGSFKTDFYADDGGLKSTRIDLQDTWLDMEIGGSLSIGRNTYLYGTYTHNFGADMETKWRADVGVRYTF